MTHNTQALWPQMISALAEIDRELGLPDDGCNSTAQTLAAIRKLKRAAEKPERRAIAFADLLHTSILAMRAAVVAAELDCPEVGMQWIANTLDGPGALPDIEVARALGGAQALFDKEIAELEAYRAAHPDQLDEA